MSACICFATEHQAYLVSREGPAYWVRAKDPGTDMRAHTDISKICGYIWEARVQGLRFSLMSFKPSQLARRNRAELFAFLFM